MYRILVLGFGNCLGSSITTFLDVFKIANDIWQKSQQTQKRLFTWVIVSENGNSVFTSSGLELLISDKLNAQRADIILIPAFAYDTFEQVIEDANEVCRWAGDWLRDRYKQGAVVASACTGTFVLGKAGLADHKMVSTSWWLKSLFMSEFPKAKINEDTLVTCDGRIFSGGPLMSHYHIALQIIEEMVGHHIAMQCLKFISIDSIRPTQFTFQSVKLKLSHWDEQILRAQFWIQSNIHRSFEINEVASAVNMSTRTLTRRFKAALNQSPVSYIQDIRIDIAKRLLETTDLVSEQILDRIGYTDSSSFRRLFKQKTGLSVSEYKNSFLKKTKSEVVITERVIEEVLI